MNAHTAIMAPGIFSGFVTEGKSDNAQSMAAEQAEKKPAIDDVVCRYLDGSTLKDALNFIDYIKASKMKVKWTAANVWSVRYKNKHVLDIIISADSWRVRLAFDHMMTSHVLSKHEAEKIRNLIGALRKSDTEILEPALAMS